MDEGEQNQCTMIQLPCVADERQSKPTLFISFNLELHLLLNISSVEKKKQVSDLIWRANAQTHQKWPWNANTTFPHSSNPVTVQTLWNRSHQ